MHPVKLIMDINVVLNNNSDNFYSDYKANVSTIKSNKTIILKYYGYIETNDFLFYGNFTAILYAPPSLTVKYRF